VIRTPDDVTAYWRSAVPEMRHEDAPRYRATIEARLPPSFPRGTRAIDYGCGGGAGLEALHARGCDPVGVDLVMKHPRFAVARPNQLNTLPSASFGVVLSTSVLQHFPDAAYARSVLNELRRLAAPGAFGLVQVRYFNAGDGCDPSTQSSDYAARAVRSHAWTIDAFWKVLAVTGFTPLAIDLEPWRQYAWYRFTG
jgi:SAM-dependent methyltransferase